MSSSRSSGFDEEFPPQTDPQLQVVVHAGPLAGKGFPMAGNAITFGRDSDNDITWDDSLVSRHHAKITRRGTQLILEDLGSTNGTLVNGKPIEGEHILQPADIISIGSSIFGVKGFAAPSTMGLTQVSPRRLGQPPALAASAPPAPARSPKIPSEPVAPPQKSGASGLSMLAIVGILALIAAIIILAAITAYLLIPGSGGNVAQIPTVVITAPVNNSQVQLGQPVTVQATASDPTGVTRIELWVNGAKTAEATSPAQQGQPTLTASLQWAPTVPGSYTLEMKAYNAQNNVSEPATVLVRAVEGAATETPTATPTPEPPTATVPAGPSLTTLTDLNVRAGPGTNYDFVGLLLSGRTADIIGRDEGRQWWQIRFDPAPNGIGWVTADPAFSKAVNVDNIPAVQAPPPPTDTPTITPTPVPATGTPTSTPLPPTNTPTPTVTPTPTTQPGSRVQFDVSPTTIEGGQCVNVNWSVVEVREVYYQGEGVPGVGGRQECPKETTVYRLRIVKQDGSEQVEDRTVQVNNPLASAGTINIDPGQTIDFDAGTIPGDDFRWRVEGGTRRFEVLENAQLSPQGQISSLSDLRLDDCRNANYGAYTYIDGSDVINDPSNALTAGRSACFKTNQGRLGKLRFPAYSTQSLTVEWVTWK